jgi:hypothetical protein
MQVRAADPAREEEWAREAVSMPAAEPTVARATDEAARAREAELMAAVPVERRAARAGAGARGAARLAWQRIERHRFPSESKT